MKQLVVIGGGAAGMFCAVNAARMNPKLKVLVLEKTNKLLAKVRISGGGRCNLTHACFDIEEMSRRYPRGSRFVKKAFHDFFTRDTIEWFESRDVTLKTEGDGRMFPMSNTSSSIIDCLLNEADQYGVDVQLKTAVTRINKTETGFSLELEGAAAIRADFVCIACGGFPKAGMFDWLLELGHTIEKPVPSLFTFNIPGHPITKLMGLSVEKARVKVQGSKLEQEGPLLITHWGLSGPAVLKLSAWGARELSQSNYSFEISVSWLPDQPETELQEHFSKFRRELATQKLANKNPFALPQRLWELLISQAGINGDMRWADLPSRLQHALIGYLRAYTLKVNGKTTFKEEFVTAGGITLSEIEHTTMMSKKQERLFFAGEVMDVDGITGGYNFQHAWTSGFIAATAIAELSA